VDIGLQNVLGWIQRLQIIAFEGYNDNVGIETNNWKFDPIRVTNETEIAARRQHH
jgi:hypothetical protein